MVTALVLALGAATACGNVTAPLTGPATTPSQNAEASPAPEVSPIGATSPAPGVAVNVSGVLDRGSTPQCPPGDPCDPPATATYLVFSQPGRTVVRVVVDGTGAFAVYLPPGPYTISAAPPPMQGRLTPDTVRVPQTGAVNLRLVIG